MSATLASRSSAPGTSAAPPGEIDASCRLPLLVMFGSAAVWLVIASVFAFIGSIKFHNPNFLADCAWLTYGRVRPAYVNSLLYGFCLQAGLGVCLWLLARLGGTTLAQGWLVTIGAKLWNLGVTVGIVGILAGDSTGFENLEMPRYAALMLFPGYLMIGIWSLLTFHQRRERSLFVSHWFLLAALFWFPWIYSTAQVLLVALPVRGVAQAVIAWWYSQNLVVVWFGLVGLAAIFYFVPKLTNRELHSHYLALFAFWALILFGSWGGIPNSAPVPAWMPALSTVGTVLTILTVLTTALNVCRTVEGNWSGLLAGPPLCFIGFGVIAFVVAGLLNAAGAVLPVSQITDLTWFTPATALVNCYGFFVMVMFGAIYYIAPKLTGLEFPSPKLVRAHFWLAGLGVVLIVLPLALGGIVQGFKLRKPEVPFAEVVKATLPFLRASTMGDLLLLAGHVLFLANVGGLITRFCRSRATSAYAAVTADLFDPAEAQP